MAPLDPPRLLMANEVSDLARRRHLANWGNGTAGAARIAVLSATLSTRAGIPRADPLNGPKDILDG